MRKIAIKENDSLHYHLINFTIPDLQAELNKIKLKIDNLKQHIFASKINQHKQNILDLLNVTTTFLILKKQEEGPAGEIRLFLEAIEKKISSYANSKQQSDALFTTHYHQLLNNLDQFSNAYHKKYPKKEERRKIRL